RPHVGGHPHLHDRVYRRLAGEVLVDRWRQPDAEVAELRGRVAAPLVRRGVAEDIVRIDEGDHQAEGLGENGLAEPALGLTRIDLVPALTLAGVAAAEVLRLGVLARVR